MQKTVKINLDVWHAEIKGDKLVIYGYRENGRKDINTEVHISMRGKEWFPQNLGVDVVKYFKAKAQKLIDSANRIKTA